MSFAHFDMSQLPKTCTNICVASLHLAGLSPEEKERVEIDKLYKNVHGSKLKDDIYHELKSLPKDKKLDKKTDLNALSRTIEAGLIKYAQARSDDDIVEFFIEVRDKERKKSNVGGVVKLATGIQRGAQNYLIETALKNKSRKAWKKIQSLFNYQKPISELYIYSSPASFSSVVTNTYLLILAIYLFAQYLNNTHDFRTAAHSFLNIGGSAGGFLFIATYLASENPPSYRLPVFKTSSVRLTEFVNAAIDQYNQDYSQRRIIEYKEDATLKPSSQPKSSGYADIHQRLSQTTKRKHLPSESKKEEKNSVEKQKTKLLDQANKNTYYLVHFDHLENVFFKSNRQQLIQIMSAAGEKDKTRINNLLDKFKTEALNGRVIPKNSDEWGFCLTDEVATGIKLRIRDDFRLELARRPATKEEKELGINEVLSPTKGGYH